MWAGSEESGQQRRKMDGVGELVIRNLGLLFSVGMGRKQKGVGLILLLQQRSEPPM